MSVSIIEAQIDAVREEATRAQAHHNRSVKAVNSDSRLSDEGRREELAQWNASTKLTLQGLRAKEEQIVKNAIIDREKQIDAKMGNTASDLIAFRDAQDRAERIETVNEAQRIMERALRTDDTSLAHAIFRRSIEQGWKSPIEPFTKAKPDLAGVVKELAVLSTFRDSTFARTVAYSI